MPKQNAQTPLDTAELTKQFFTMLAERNLNAHDGVSHKEVWTPAITKTLVDLARKPSFKCEAWPKFEGEGKDARRKEEWMLDCVWKKEASYCLGAESELGSGADVLDDFEKLLWMKCPVKLLVFVTPDGDAHKDLHKEIRNYIQEHPHHLEHEVYLFFEIQFWGEKDKPSKIRAYEFIVRDFVESGQIRFCSILGTKPFGHSIKCLGTCEVAEL